MQNILALYGQGGAAKTALRGKTYLKNAALLTVAGFALRALGMVFRVFVAARLGPEGMGLYQLILSVYMVFVSLASAGINVASTRLGAQCLTRGRGMAPVIGAALDGRRALMLCIASLILVTFTRVLAVAICHLTKNRFRPVVYCYSAALLYIPTYVLLYALFGSDLTLLGIYLPIMVVEPAIVKRMEFSDLEPVRDAFRHGFNNALGMCVVLLIVGCLRELLATGAVFGNVILHNALLPLAALPAGGFVIVGILAAIWCAAANLYTDYKHEEVRRLYADRKH